MKKKTLPTGCNKIIPTSADQVRYSKQRYWIEERNNGDMRLCRVLYDTYKLTWSTYRMKTKYYPFVAIAHHYGDVIKLFVHVNFHYSDIERMLEDYEFDDIQTARLNVLVQENKIRLESLRGGYKDEQ